MSTATLVAVSDLVAIRFEYDEDTVELLNHVCPKKKRKWDRSANRWVMTADAWDDALDLTYEHSTMSEFRGRGWPLAKFSRHLYALRNADVMRNAVMPEYGPHPHFKQLVWN